MLRFMSIRSRLVSLSLLMIASLIGTNALLIHQTRLQNELITEQARNIDVIVRADTAVQTFGNLKYWLTDLAVTQLALSRTKAVSESDALSRELGELNLAMPGSVTGVAEQVVSLQEDITGAAEAYGQDDRLVGNAMMQRGRAHILAVDSKLSTLVASVRANARDSAEASLQRTEDGIRLAMGVVVVVALAAGAFTLISVGSVVGPLRQLVDVINALIAGDINAKIPTTGRDEIGSIAKLLTLFRDSILRQRKAETALRESEQRFATIIDHMPATVFLRDLEGRFIVINQYYADFYRLDRASVPGQFTADLLYTELAHESDAHDREVIAEQSVIEREIEATLDGKTHTLWSVKFPVRDTTGAMVALGGIELDITGRKQTEELARAATEAAAAAESRLSDAIENMSEAIVVYDAADRLVLCNTRFKEFYNYAAEDVMPGTSYGELVRLDIERGAVRTDEASNYVRLRDQHRERLEGTQDVQLRDGRWLQIRERLAGGGQIVSIQADITERKHAEMALLESKQEAELANQAKSQFLANMSHELRTPLNAIIGITEMLSEDVEDAGEKGSAESLQRIHGAGHQLLGLIDEILDLSKIEAGKMELHPSVFDLCQLVESVVKTTTPLATRNRNQILGSYPDNMARVQLDETRVRQVILNLVSNAVKFTEDGQITVSVCETSDQGGGGVSITVTDTGIGISAEQRERLFRPFVQGDASTSRKYGGTGLGLAISRHFCQMMGGKIMVDSTLGEGSRFTVWLPNAER